MGLDLVLKNAKIVTSLGIIEGNLGISRGKIVQIGKLKDKAEKELDLKSKFILPGAIDMHVHFRDPGFTEKEDFASGSRAAAAGGVTTVVDMPNTLPPTLTFKDFEEKRLIAMEKSIVNFGLYMGFDGHNLEEIKKAKSFPEMMGVKIYQDFAAIEKLFSLGLFVIVHAEDENIIRENSEKYLAAEKSSAVDPSIHSLIRGSSAAREAVKTILHLAKKHNARVHITHVSTIGEVEELRKFKSEAVSADCTPHHLFLTQSAYADRGNFVKVNPPLRTNKDRQALWNALHEGIIQAVASDHAPHTKKEKEQSYEAAPAGVPGVETMLPLLLDAVNHGEVSLQDVVKWTSENPAKLLGFKNKGRIEVGAIADLTVVDMNCEQEVGGRGHKLKTKCNWSPFSGWKLKGWPVLTMVNGKIVYNTSHE
ncbi:dihydroorotase [Candidatus Peregrinibacteria bacterium]|nr:dihydroorotase [Candidatus Peregrinibacteria bacterium]